MSIFSALYRLLIGPLELFFEILFTRVNAVLDHPGVSIIVLSLVMNFLVLPLYRRADAMQEEERATNERLKHWTAHIKKTFKGDERFMIMQTYYRQNNYKPTDALKGSVSLLLEIPFFMAAYNFLSKLPVLQGASLGPISNLGAPDGLLVLGGIAINILPILMTTINLVSSAIYTKGMSTKSKVQLYVMATLFLVLLYDSPAGLVFYWTLNNLFSLVKNIFYKLKDPRKVFCILASTVSIVLLAFSAVTHPMPTETSQIILYCLLMMLHLPLIGYVLGKRFPRRHTEIELTAQDKTTFWSCGLFMTVLTGVMIPAGVIHSSPEEFINPVTQVSPLLYVLNTALSAAGIFLVWSGVFYMLASDGGKKWMGRLMGALCLIGTVNFMFFGKDYGNMSPDLVFDLAPVYSHQLLNLLLAVALAALVIFLCIKKQELFRFVVLTATVASLAMSTLNMTQIHAAVKDKTEQLCYTSSTAPVIPLSREGKNVVVLMMDRAVNAYIPYLMNEKPELKEQLAGFTYYPNTLSFGAHTNFGSPALFGGYEYTPEEINKRKDETLVSKQNEALKVMPAIFYEQGFTTTVFDPPYAGYDWVPDLSIYDDYPDLHAFNSMGQFGLESDPAELVEKRHQSRNRNFFCYSLFKVVPEVMRRYIYDNGQYNKNWMNAAQQVESTTSASGMNPAFVRAYAVLRNLENITEIRDDAQNTFLMLTNDATHEPALLQEPEYEPAETVNNTEYDAAHTDRFLLNDRELKMETTQQAMHYHVNMATMLKLGAWFDYLRAEGVFDNTRIIIVSDHGGSMNHYDDWGLPGSGEEIMNYNPILLVKDFGSQEFTTDNTFMTNADTPTLAMAGMVENPVNPFTGKPINSDPKLSGPQSVFCSHIWDTAQNGTNTFLPGLWYTVQDNIFDLNNWVFQGEK